jgi:hypothetical protein
LQYGHPGVVNTTTALVMALAALVLAACCCVAADTFTAASLDREKTNWLACKLLL